jgi:predicted RNase H-like HicB family nuclease
MLEKEYTILIKAIWDDEAGVWVATSEDVPGLVVEAKTTDELEAELKIVVPELLKLNDSGIAKQQEVPIHLLQESHFIASCA